MTVKYCLIAIAILALVVPAWAESLEPVQQNRDEESRQADPTDRMTTTTQTTHYGSSGGGSDIGWNGWGLRAGFADDIDQAVGGAHFNLGEFVPHLRFQPDVQLGTGDDHTTIYGTAPVYYRFGTETRFTPYAGGGVSMGFVDRDLPANSTADDSDFEVGGKVTGGMEWDVHDAQVIAAWSF
jgi:opacity protein-like surface antigen